MDAEAAQETLSQTEPPQSPAGRWAAVLISFGILVWLARQVDIEKTASSLRTANAALLLAGAFAFSWGIILRAWRWQLLVNKDEQVCAFRDALVVIFIASALNVLLPASMGDIARSYYGYRRIGRKEVMVSASLVDKCLGLLAAFMPAVPLAAWMGFWSFFWIGTAVTAALTAFLFLPKLVPWTAVAWTAARLRIRFDPAQLLAAATLEPRLLLVTFAISVLAWISLYLQFYLAFLAFGGHVAFGEILTLTPIVMLTKLLPLTLDGLGAQEVVSVQLFASIGVPSHITLLATLTSRLVGSWLPALVGAGMIFESRRWRATPVPAQREMRL